MVLTGDGGWRDKERNRNQYLGISGYIGQDTDISAVVINGYHREMGDYGVSHKVMLTTLGRYKILSVLHWTLGLVYLRSKDLDSGMSQLAVGLVVERAQRPSKLLLSIIFSSSAPGPRF